MKLPMKRKMIGSANGANAADAGATPSSTTSVGPTSAVTDSGSASVIQKTTMRARIAARRWAGGGSAGAGSARISAKSTGPMRRPAVRRRRLKCSSAGE